MTIFDTIDNSNYKEKVIKNFFNCLEKRVLSDYIEMMRAGQSFGDENHFCLFPSALEEGEIKFSGVKIIFLDYEVIISTDELEQYIQLANQTIK